MKQKLFTKLHVLIQEISGNKILVDILNGLRQKLLLRHRQLYHKDRFKKSMQEHRQLLEALGKRDPALADTHMKRHFIKQYKALVDLHSGRKTNSDQQRAA
ncbi:MAG: FCD domain-containing protein [Desulfobacteraceae bacterium]|nr:FCD domain-containing protein [Desulfobacteraceae bacterium]